jgi:transposase InsO family protein
VPSLTLVCDNVLRLRPIQRSVLLSDKGRQFDCPGYRAWCGRRGIDPRYASTGSLRATAVIERFFLSFKSEWLRRILVPLRREDMRRELSCYIHAHSRPHQGLDGRTPQEVYDGLPVAERTRAEPKDIRRLELVLRFYQGRRELPLVELRRAAA